MLKGYGTVGQSMNVALAPRWNLQIPDDKLYKFDIKEANKILDDAGYKDTNNDGVREMPDGSNPLKFRYKIRSTSSLDTPTSQFIKGWMKQIGISVDVQVVSEDELTPIENAGTFDFATWAWVPFTDPDAQLSYLTCDAAARRSPTTAPTTTRSTARRPTTSSTSSRTASSTKRSASTRSRRCSRSSTTTRRTSCCTARTTLQAYNSDKFTGFTPVPDPGGPIMVANDFLNYSNVKLAGGGSGGGASTVVLIVIGVVVALGIIVALVMMMGRRRSADLRD